MRLKAGDAPILVFDAWSVFWPPPPGIYGQDHESGAGFRLGIQRMQSAA